MGFSHEFADNIRSRFSDDEEILKALEEGDRPKMAMLLLERMKLSPQAILERLEKGEQDALEQDCETAKPIAVLLKRLLEYEMTHGFAIARRAFDAHNVPL